MTTLDPENFKPSQHRYAHRVLSAWAEGELPPYPYLGICYNLYRDFEEWADEDSHLFDGYTYALHIFRELGFAFAPLAFHTEDGKYYGDNLWLHPYAVNWRVSNPSITHLTRPQLCAMMAKYIKEKYL